MGGGRVVRGLEQTCPLVLSALLGRALRTMPQHFSCCHGTPSFFRFQGFTTRAKKVRGGHLHFFETRLHLKGELSATVLPLSKHASQLS